MHIVMNYIPLVARILLGLVFVVFGINYWLQFMPNPDLGDTQAAAFMGALYMSNTLLVIKILEVVCGALLLAGRLVNLAIIILSGIILNINFFHILMLGSGQLMGIVLAVLALIVIFSRKELVQTVFRV